MKAKRYHYSRKFRQLQLALKTYRQQQARSAPENSLQKLQAKIRRLFKQLNPLRNYIPHYGKALAGAALMLGLSLPMQAQISFGANQDGAFGLAPANDLSFIAMGDLDDDGDIDMISMGYDYGSGYYGGVAFFFHENTGTPTEPMYAAPESLNLVTGDYTTPFLADLDGDGDLDLIVGTYDYASSGFYFFENTGTPSAPNFVAPVLNPFGIQADAEITIPYFADLDGDGDLDLISSGYYGLVSYYQNTGTATAPAFAAPTQLGLIAGTSMPELRFLSFADLDNDGDLDLLLGDYISVYYGGSPLVGFIENIGTPEAQDFNSSYIENPFGLSSAGLFDILAMADLDSDGDMDLVRSSLSAYGSSMIYNENETLAPTSEESAFVVQEGEVHVFSADDFIFNPATSGDELKTLRLMSLPALGTLDFNGNPAELYQKIDVLELNQLVYTPGFDIPTPDYTSFEFKVAGEAGVFNLGTNTMTVDLLIGTSTSEVSAGALAAKLSPNPATGNTLLSLQLPQQTDLLQARLFDLQGRLVWQYQAQQSGAVQLPISLQGLPASQYILQLSHGQHHQTLPLLVK